MLREREVAVNRLRDQITRSWWSTSLSSHFVTEHQNHNNTFHQHRGASLSSTSSNTTHAMNPDTNDVAISIDVHGLGISIVDSTPRELLYCGASMIKMRLERKEIDTSTHNAASTSTSSATSATSASSLQEKRSSLHVACQIGSLQIDNQLHTTLYPVLLHTDQNAVFGALSLPRALIHSRTHQRRREDMPEGRFQKF